jgi:hypothetical protein
MLLRPGTNILLDLHFISQTHLKVIACCLGLLDHADSGRFTPVSPASVSDLNQWNNMLLRPGTNILLDLHFISQTHLKVIA